MRRDFTTRKRIILGTVSLLVLADVALAAYSWELASTPRATPREIAQHTLQLKLMQAELDRAQKIRDTMPNTQQECEKFEGSLLQVGSGYSSVSSELGEIAKKSGARLDDLAFKQALVPEHAVAELLIDSTIAGDYKNVIQFLNGLQRSANNYIVESLTLAPEGANQGPANLIKVSLHIRTYLRTTA